MCTEKDTESEDGSDIKSGQVSDTASHEGAEGNKQSDLNLLHLSPQFKLTQLNSISSGSQSTQSRGLETNTIVNEQNPTEEELNMSTSMEVPEFLRLCGTTMNKPYSGDPLALNSFMDAIDLLNSLATSTVLRQILLSFIKTKLDGRAREFLVDTVTTIDGLKQALTNNIKPDNSSH